MLATTSLGALGLLTRRLELLQRYNQNCTGSIRVLTPVLLSPMQSMGVCQHD